MLPADLKTSKSTCSSADVETFKGKKKRVKIEDPDSFLHHLDGILHRIHSTFYSQFTEMTNGHDISTMSDIPTPDLKLIIPKMRQSVLKGAKILFTGVIPTNVPPQRSPIWNTARAFGAIIHDKLVPGLDSTNPRTVMRATTHVIAGKSGTVKLKEARRVPGIKIVSPRWLWNCAEQWKWLEERLYPVESEKEPSKETKREVGMKTSGKGVERNELKTEPAADGAFKDEQASETSTESKAHAKEKLLASEKPGHSRLVSLESRLSVSDEELERMEAEVDAEIGSSSSSSSDEVSQDQGQSKKQQQGKNNTSKSELFVESVSTNNKWPGRKRKHAEMDDICRAPAPRSNPDLHEQSDSNGSNSSDSEDELAALLEGSENNTFLS